MATDERAAQNTDREIWWTDDYSIFVTEGDGLGINVGGHVIVKPVCEWFRLADQPPSTGEPVASATGPRLTYDVKGDVLYAALRSAPATKSIEKPLQAVVRTDSKGVVGITIVDFIVQCLAASPAAPDVVGEIVKWQPTKAEVQSGYDRLKFAEGLIKQLPETHDGRNTWLLNYGRSEEAARKRLARNIQWDDATQASGEYRTPTDAPDA